MVKVLVTGANGQLGSSIKSIKSLFEGIELSFTGISELDICNLDDIDSYLSGSKFHYIINCAAYTAVDKAENENKLAESLNIQAVSNLSKAAKKHNCKLIHISTDYVFDGKAHKPYTEECIAKPESVYGITKLEGERIALKNNTNTIVIRTSWLYSEFGNNYVKTMLNFAKEKKDLRITWDQVGCPTYAVDLAKAILQIIKSEIYQPGVYHFSNEGICSRYDFTISIFELGGIIRNVLPILSKEYLTPAPRPLYSALDKQKIKQTYNIKIAHWRTSLKTCLQQLDIIK